MPRMLYFPNFTPPRHVLNQALLYWDGLVVIAPSGYERDIDPRLAVLWEAGLYQTVDPRDVVSPQLRAEALRILAFLSRKIPRDELIPPRAESVHEMLELQREEWERRVFLPPKFSRALGEELMHAGLAERVPDRPDVLLVAPRVQMALLSIIARELAIEVTRAEGALSSNGLIPQTDNWQAYFASMGYIKPKRRLGQELPPSIGKAWVIDLGGLLPVPDDSVDLVGILEFRERYSDERIRLASGVQKLIQTLTLQYESPKDVYRQMESELKIALSDLESAGRAMRISWARRSASVTIAIASAVGTTYTKDYSWILGVIGGIAINIATNTIRRGIGSSAVDVTYLYRVEKELSRYR